MRICRQSLTLLLLLVAGGAWSDTSHAAILQINSVPTPPSSVITPNGGTFDQPLTVSITPAVSTVLGNTPGCPAICG